MTPQPHPNRCENCSDWMDGDCMLIERWLSDQEYNLIEMVGCASFNLIGSQIRSRPATSPTPYDHDVIGEFCKTARAEAAAQAREEVLNAGLLYQLVYWSVLFRDKNNRIPTGEELVKKAESLRTGGDE